MPDAQHARVHSEEGAGIPEEELVVQRLLQLVPDEALVRHGERGHEEGQERDDEGSFARGTARVAHGDPM